MASKTSDLIFRFIGKDETGAAAKSAASNLDHIGSKASGLGKTLAGLGAAVSVGIIASKVTDFAKASVQSFETVGGESMKLQRIMGGNVAQMSAKVSPSSRALMKKGAMVPVLACAWKLFCPFRA